MKGLLKDCLLLAVFAALLALCFFPASAGAQTPCECQVKGKGCTCNGLCPCIQLVQATFAEQPCPGGVCPTPGVQQRRVATTASYATTQPSYATNGRRFGRRRQETVATESVSNRRGRGRCCGK